jgi:hypothetical protein
VRGCQSVSSMSVSTRADEGIEQGNGQWRGLGTTSSDASKRLSKEKPVDFNFVSLEALTLHNHSRECSDFTQTTIGLFSKSVDKYQGIM